MIVNRNLLRPGGPFSFPTGYSPDFNPTHLASKGITPFSGGSFIPIGGSYVDIVSGFSKWTKGGTITAGNHPILGPTTVCAAGADLYDNTAPVYSSSANETEFTIAGFIAPTSLSTQGGILGTSENSSKGNNLSVTTAGKLKLIVGTTSATSVNCICSVGHAYFVLGSYSHSNLLATFLTLDLATGIVVSETVSATLTLAASTLFGLVSNSPDNSLAGAYGPLMYNPYNAVNLTNANIWANAPWDFWYPRNLTTAMYVSGGAINLTASQIIPTFTSAETLAALVQAGATQNVPVFASVETLAAYVAVAVAQTIPDFVDTETLSHSTALNAVASQAVPDFTDTETLAALLQATSSQTIPNFAAAETLAALVKAAVAQTDPPYGQTFSAVVLSSRSITGSQTIPGFPQVVTVSDRRKHTTVYIII